MGIEATSWDRHLVTLEAEAKRVLLPAMRNAEVIIVICPPEKPDVKVAVELGLAIYLDKLILVLVPPNRRPSDHLVRVADRILGVPEDAHEWPELVEAVVEEMTGSES